MGGPTSVSLTLASPTTTTSSTCTAPWCSSTRRGLSTCWPKVAQTEQTAHCKRKDEDACPLFIARECCLSFCRLHQVPERP